MNIRAELRRAFRRVLSRLVDDPEPYVLQVLAAQEERFGDYQANCAMALARPLGKPPRQIAQQIVSELDISAFCEPAQIAGPGFINLRLRTDWLGQQLQRMVTDPRLDIPPTAEPRTVIIDYSSPNVAKPMHVGHIRSTVIGDALYRTMKFLGHRVLSDNHLGDWGTQFGMILYGYKHFLDADHYRREPVAELSRLYKLVHQLIEYQEAAQELSMSEALHAMLMFGGAQLEKAAAEALSELEEARDALAENVSHMELDPELRQLAEQYPNIAAAVLEETARLHAGDGENRRLWEEFMPHCLEEIHRIYRRLGIRFDMQLGESFYQPMLADVVRDLKEKGLATTSDGAVCVFLDGFDSPMIIQKSDGAYLYATTDLATLRYRMSQFHPDSILYVVDARQSDHFAKLFAVARLWGYQHVELTHVSFGTVLGEDGRPFKTREGEVVSLEALLDEAVQRALRVVCQVDDAKPDGPELSIEERNRVAWVVGHAAVKYRDLAHNRTSDYVFSFDKMLALDGNTAAYLLYAYARVHNIFVKGGIEREQVRQFGEIPQLPTAEERALAVSLIRFHETLEDVLVDYRPNILTNYLYDLAQRFSRFYTSPQCRVLNAETKSLRQQRLLLCDLVGRVLQQGLDCLGIEVVPKM